MGDFDALATEIYSSLVETQKIPSGAQCFHNTTLMNEGESTYKFLIETCYVTSQKLFSCAEICVEDIQNENFLISHNFYMLDDKGHKTFVAYGKHIFDFSYTLAHCAQLAHEFNHYREEIVAC